MRLEGPVRVLLIDDSPVNRRLLVAELAADPDLSAIGVPSTRDAVRSALLRHHPDILLLDLGVVLTDALLLVRQLRQHYPVPILACADASATAARLGVRALAAGVAEILERNSASRPEAAKAFARVVAPRLRALALDARPVGSRPAAAILPPAVAGFDPRRRLVVVGASTGGTEAIASMLAGLPPNFPPIVIVQHMPVGFTRSFADRLNGLCVARVTEAVDREPVRPGCVLVARGDAHLIVERSADAWQVRYIGRLPPRLHCPSVDVLFESAARAAGAAAAGVLLTGMGDDGAAGLLAIRRAGGFTVVQEAASCVVNGMPAAATALGAACATFPPQSICARLVDAFRARQGAAAAPTPAPQGS